MASKFKLTNISTSFIKFDAQVNGLIRPVALDPNDSIEVDVVTSHQNELRSLKVLHVQRVEPSVAHSATTQQTNDKKSAPTAPVVIEEKQPADTKGDKNDKPEEKSNKK